MAGAEEVRTAADHGLRVLLVEDSEDDALLIERALRKGGHEPETVRVETREGMTRALAEDEWQVVLADHKLPRFSAMEALEVLKASGKDLPFLVVTGTIGEEKAAELLRAGAHDFLLKDRLARLAPAIEREIREATHRRERRVARLELERAHARYGALIEKASDVIHVVDPDGRIRYSSPSAEALLGRAPADLEGMDALLLVHPDDRERIRRELRTLVEEGGSRRAEYRIEHADGQVRQVESVASNLLLDDAVRGIVVNTRDLTERRALEEQLFQSQKMEAIGRLAGGIAHDFNNLLTVITGNTEMILPELEEGSEAREDLEQAISAARRASSLTRQLLAFSRRQVMNPRVVDVRSVLEGMQDMLTRLIGEDVALEVRPGDQPRLARVDPTQLEQVMMNLAVNAREVMPSGGRVRIELGEERVDGAGEGGRLAPGRYVRLTVADSGPGISAELRDRIFEPFFTTKEHGTGLGLSTVYGIVTQSAGDIRVSCPPEGGAVFTILLPEAIGAEDPRSEDLPSAEGRPPKTRGERLLLVEDNDDVRSVTLRILVREGYEVLEATSGEEALAVLESEVDVDLLITDLVMPGIHGPELGRRVHEARPHVPILYMSGYSGDQILESRQIAATGDFLEKPFTPQELSARVGALLESGGAADR